MAAIDFWHGEVHIWVLTGPLHAGSEGMSWNDPEQNEVVSFKGDP